MTDQRLTVTTLAAGIARLSWDHALHELGFMGALAAVQPAVEAALGEHHRVETLVAIDDETAQRIATWSGLRREGVLRGVVDGDDRILYARLATDAPVSDPHGFRSLLNSFLPRKRAISQVLIRDEDDRVLLCQLTYKQDWDLPGGVVEVGESPELAAVREVKEELGLDVQSSGLLLTDWLPPWGGWDDAICLVFDGGRQVSGVEMVRQEREIRAAEFCTMEQVHERTADFTARRIESALRNLDGGPSYTESGG